MTVSRDQLAFSVADAQAARESGIADAYSADRVQDWKRQADAWLHLCRPGEEFSADDLVAGVGLPDEGPNRNNVVGAWVNAQKTAGRIVWTGRFGYSARVVRHRNPQRVWRKI